jgi:predicted CopG family antitoxin
MCLTNMVKGTTIQISKKNYDYLTKIGGKKESYDQIIGRLISKLEGESETHD